MNYIEFAMQKRKEWKEIVDREIDSIIKELRGVVEDHPIIDEVTYWTRDFNFRGGKRTRPSLCLGSYIACNGDMNYWEDAVKVAAGIELTEAWFLVHDDIMDRSERRRGGKAIHVIFREKYLNEIGKDAGEAEHFGISEAINVGDLMAGLVGYAFSKANIPTFKEALIEWSKTITVTAYGQALDVYMGSLPLKDVNEDLVYKVHYHKAGAYSVEGPVLVGAALAGADQELKRILSEYGRPLGIAFQLWDDVLGLYGDPQKTGKPIDADVKEGKRTLLIVKALEFATPEQRKILLENYGNPDPDLEAIKQIVKETGAYEYNVKKVQELAQKAKDALEKNRDKFNEEGYAFLMGFADYLVTREL